MRRLPGTLSFLAPMVVGCVPAPVPVIAPSLPPGKCVSGAGQQLVGTTADTAFLVSEAKRTTGATTVRIVRPDQAVTMDYREDRVTLRLDGQGRVARVSCG